MWWLLLRRAGGKKKTDQQVFTKNETEWNQQFAQFICGCREKRCREAPLMCSSVGGSVGKKKHMALCSCFSLLSVFETITNEQLMFYVQILISYWFIHWGILFLNCLWWGWGCKQEVFPGKPCRNKRYGEVWLPCNHTSPYLLLLSLLYSMQFLYSLYIFYLNAAITGSIIYQCKPKSYLSLCGPLCFLDFTVIWLIDYMHICFLDSSSCGSHCLCKSNIYMC